MIAITTPAPTPTPTPTYDVTVLNVAAVGEGDHLVVTFDRTDVDGTLAPFSIDPTLLDVSLVNVGGNHDRPLRPRSDAASTSHLAILEGGEHGAGERSDVVRLSYRIGPGIEPAFYTLHVQRRADRFDGETQTHTLIFQPSPQIMFVSDAAGRAETIDHLRARYLHAFVHGYGGSVSILCSTATGTSGFAVPSARIASIEPAPELNQTLRAGNTFAFGQTGSYLDLFPIRVRFDQIHGPASFGYIADDLPADADDTSAMANPAAACKNAHLDVAGAWDFERFITRRGAADHLEWPKKFRRAISKGIPIVGMTPEMVAYIWGYPAMYGTKHELAMLPSWTYELPMSSPNEVDFQHGHVTSVQVGQLFKGF